MPFIMPELVVESILRDGLRIIKDTIDTPDDLIEEIFGDLRSNHLNEYFGDSEINKIKRLIKEHTLYISQGYPLTDVKLPLININLQNTSEAEQYAAHDDFIGEEDTEIEDIIIVPEFTADNYNPVTGLIQCNFESPDLSQVQTGNIFKDGDGKEFSILGGIENTNDEKHFFISKGQTVNLVDAVITGGIKRERAVLSGVRTSENILLSISSEQALLTKYLATIVTFVILANKTEMIKRGLELSSFDISDFARADDRMPENIWTRFITLRIRFVEHSWSIEKAQLINLANASIKVKRDLYPRDNEANLTVKTILE